MRTTRAYGDVFPASSFNLISLNRYKTEENYMMTTRIVMRTRLEGRRAQQSSGHVC